MVESLTEAAARVKLGLPAGPDRQVAPRAQPGDGWLSW
jgi:hypothetical protein